MNSTTTLRNWKWFLIKFKKLKQNIFMADALHLRQSFYREIRKAYQDC